MKYLGTCLIMACLAAPFAASALASGDYSLLAWPLAALCLWRVEPERVLRGHALVVGLLLAATVLCCLGGAIENYHHGPFASYGIINTTDFAAYFVFLLLCLWCTQENREWYATLSLGAASLAVGVACDALTGSRTALVCCAIIAAACAWEWVEGVLVRRAGPVAAGVASGAGGLADALSVAAFPLCALATAVLVCARGQELPWAVDLDALLSGRLWPAWSVYQQQGIHAFGSNFLMHGRGGSALGIPGADYDFLDIGYAFLLLRYGAATFATLMGLWAWTGRRALAGGRRRLAWSMGVVAVYALSECHLLSAHYNVFLLMPLCDLSQEVWQEGEEPEPGRPWAWRAGLGAALAACALCALPRLASWLRTFFFLEGWTSGARTAWALLLCGLLACAAYLLWRGACAAALGRTWRAAALACLPLAVLLLCAAAGEAAIARGLAGRAAELDAEEPAVRGVLGSAAGPVYALERSELYRRRLGGFADAADPVAELVRAGAGTLVVDRADEVIALEQCGALYAELSETSGVYTLDPQVVDALAARGYAWRPFYSSERACDLREAAGRCGLGLDGAGGALVGGPSRGELRSGRMDLLAGTYDVRVSIACDPGALAALGADEELCALSVVYNEEEAVAARVPITRAQLSDDGSGTVNYTITLSTIPRAQYLLSAADGITISVREIAWRRVE